MLTPSAPVLERPRSPHNPQNPVLGAGMGQPDPGYSQRCPRGGQQFQQNAFETCRGASLRATHASCVVFLGDAHTVAGSEGWGRGQHPREGATMLILVAWRWWLRGAWAGPPPNPAPTPGTELVRLSTGCEHEAGRIWPMDVPRGTEEMLRAGLGCCEVPGTPAQPGSRWDGHLPAQGTCWGRVEPPLPGPISPGCSEGRGRAGRGRGKNNNNKKKGATPSPSPEALLWTLQIRFSEKEMFYRP